MNENDKGLKAEDDLIAQFNLTASSQYDNIHNDIDAWEGKKSISIKSQQLAEKTGNLSFELKLINHRDPLDQRESWFYTSKADEYWIIVGKTVYVFDAQVLKAFILENDWMFRKTKLTNQALIDENIKAGRKYCQSESILVSLSGLESKGLVEEKLYL
jgi:enolase